MTLILEQPNVEAIVGKKLRDAGIPGVTGVHSSIPTDAVFPLITVQRVGVIPVIRQYLDAANIQVDVWGTSKTDAFNIAARARVLLHEMAGTSFTDPVKVWVSAVEDSLGITWQPDPDTGRDRYLFSVLVYARTM